jgi:predicted Ser/Thr protein kinase
MKNNTTLTDIYQKLNGRMKRTPIPFSHFLEDARDKPQIVFRDIFQLVSDMMYYYVPPGKDEYSEDPESINFVHYDCSKLFSEGVDHPFSADRLFANRLMKLIDSFGQDSQKRKINLFNGPHGSGKSTFLNIFLDKFEQYANTEDGMMYETIWRLDTHVLDKSRLETVGSLSQKRHSSMYPSSRRKRGNPHIEHTDKLPKKPGSDLERYIEVVCPSHDHPILQIPKSQRAQFLDELLAGNSFKEELFTQKEYEWVFKETACAVCTPLYQVMLDRLDSPSSVFNMLYARRYQFNRKLGEGISAFNPGDELELKPIKNPVIQELLNQVFKDSNLITYIFSEFARTNNGIYVITDVKGNNKERLRNLHGIISDGVHKVGHVEENIKSLFIGLINPQDQEFVGEDKAFKDRVVYIPIPYVLDYHAEVDIYKSTFGEEITTRFLPHVLDNFAKAIIASRLNRESDGLEEWISKPQKYGKYCDDSLLLLKMELYTGSIPEWLSENDRKSFNAERRKRIICESEFEGYDGFSGRESIHVFNDFFMKFNKKHNLVNMEQLHQYFTSQNGDLSERLPPNFLDALLRSYNYTILQEVKESLYNFNEEKIENDILNYIYAVNFKSGESVNSFFTGDIFIVSESFYEPIESRIIGAKATATQRNAFRRDIQRQYVSKATQEIDDDHTIKDTGLYKSLFERYVRNTKENVLDPLQNSDNFRMAIKEYGTKAFKSYDPRLRSDVNLLFSNLERKFGYTRSGAKEICQYVIEKNLLSDFR